MEAQPITLFPRRITDLTKAKTGGSDVRLEINFEILPVEFLNCANPFQAYIFLARYTGSIDGRAFEFRKCYARGCPNNLCTHVSQAVNIANRYLQRDYHALEMGGIEAEKDLFSLDDMIIKFETLKGEGPPHLAIPELAAMAKTGKVIAVQVALELIPAVEHFSGVKNAQTYLSGVFRAQSTDEVYHCHRCFACFPTDKEDQERETAVKVANARLATVYDEFKRSGVICQAQYFQ